MFLTNLVLLMMSKMNSAGTFCVFMLYCHRFYLFSAY